MRLTRLELENFRQHAGSVVDLEDGITAIVGPNGAGKSTLVEAVAWALYGAPAARGTNDTIPFAKSVSGATVRVDLNFELDGHEYRVERTLGGAEVRVDRERAPAASGIAAVGDYLRHRLGMTREEFFNTFFTGQKDLQFLARLGPAERGRFLNQVLGYERLRAAQDAARARLREVRHEAAGLRAALPDPARLRADLEEAERRLREARAAIASSEARRCEEEEAVVRSEPRWKELRESRERDRDLAHRLELARRESGAAQEEVARLEAATAGAVAAESAAAALRERLKPLPELEKRCADFEERARRAARRRALEETERMLAADAARESSRLEELRAAPELLAESRAELERTAAELHAAEAETARIAEEWAQRRQEVETRIQGYHQRYRELKRQLERLGAEGLGGVCPTCGRPLGGGLERVLADLEEERVTLTQDGKWLRQRAAQLEGDPPELLAARSHRDELLRAERTLGRRVARCEDGVQELKALRPRHAERIARLAALREEQEDFARDYDEEAHGEAAARLAELRELQRELGARESEAAQHGRLETDLAAARRRLDAAREREAAIAERRSALAYREADHDRAGERLEGARRRLRAAEDSLLRAHAAETAAEERLGLARRAMADHEERRSRLGGLEAELDHHAELDLVFRRLRTRLNERVRPELGTIASAFLREITDGRFSALEIDERYGVGLVDDGEERAVMSGGEEDVANLALRLAISQMIADRAGRPFSLLVLDEVFGSLDLHRQHNIVHLLGRLRKRFRQVLLVTHVETLPDGIDRVLRVDYDDATGASRITGESAPAAAERSAAGFA